MTKINKYIKQRRRQLNLTQLWVSNQAGIPISTYRLKERSGPFNDRDIEKLSEVLKFQLIFAANESVISGKSI